MKPHETFSDMKTCDCHERIYERGIVWLWLILGFVVIAGTSFPFIVPDVLDLVMRDGLYKAWGLLRSVCVFYSEPAGHYTCPEDGGSILENIIKIFFIVSMFLWLLTRQPIRQLKIMIAGAWMRVHALKQKWLGSEG